MTLRQPPLAGAPSLTLFCSKLVAERSSMICPACKSSRCRRSRRRDLLDYLISVAGVVPWRCRACEKRFRARAIPAKFLYYAHCGQCGNLNLQRISPDKVPGAFARVGRLLRLRALRCEPCRNKFFAVRPALQSATSPALSSRGSEPEY